MINEITDKLFCDTPKNENFSWYTLPILGCRVGKSGPRGTRFKARGKRFTKIIAKITEKTLNV